jgi:hypothetical protein
MMLMFKKTILCLSLIFTPFIAVADIIEFEADDFSVTPTFSDVQSFQFAIDVSSQLIPGTSYNNPQLYCVDYLVSGSLSDTPSGFRSFGLERTIAGDEYYNQGSSMQFEIDVSADLSDGLQVSELVGDGLVFQLNAREVDTGRYHPPLFELNSDGSGSIRNSNNQGGINPGSMMEVDVDFGEEFITELTFDPAALTLVAPPGEPVKADSFETCQ